ncbi:MAG: hypothetical protein ACJ788_14230 [Ktedonobacteraceae bacterium]
MRYLRSIFYREKNSFYRFLQIFGLVIIICEEIIFGSAVAFPHLVYADKSALPTACTSAVSTKPGSASLLIVLLDRSGSLGIGGSGADPQNYSGSITNALSDLWQGPMAVIAFPFGSSDTQLIGPFPPGKREALKNQVNNLTSQGSTPLESAMKVAQSLLQQQGFPKGSRIVLITDGQPQTPEDPNGQIEEQDILTTLAPQFCQEGVSISPFGITIRGNSNPANFLSQVAMETGGGYSRVAGASELASAVIGLFAEWENLEFNQITKDLAHGYYPVVIDSSVQSAYILTFYQSGQNKPLTTASGRQASYRATSDGRHYEIDALNTPIPLATYTVRTPDPNALVYDLIRSTRTLQTVQPTASTIAYTGGTIVISAHLVDQRTGPIVPHQNASATFLAAVTETVHGQTLPAQTIELTQSQPGGDLFTGKFAVPSDAKPGTAPVQIGTLQVTVMATYQGIKHTTNPLTIPVVIPKYIPPQPPCHAGFWQCASSQVYAVVIGGVPVLLLLILFLLWLRQPVPYGVLSSISEPRRSKLRPDPEDFVEVRLGSRRTFQNRLFQRSIITSEELRRHPDARGAFDFDLAQFEFVAKRSRKGPMMYIRAQHGNRGDIKLEVGNQVLSINDEIVLTPNSSIIINGQPRASYS